VRVLQQGYGRQSMAHLFPAGGQPELFVYDEHGVFEEPAKFRSLLEGAVAKAAAGWTVSKPAKLPQNAATAR
jgi:hypothetical protein